jgi:hypothetical protein
MASGWKRPFDELIPLPRGRQLVTLEDAAKYIQKLPEGRAHGAGMANGNGSQILVATRGGPTMSAFGGNADIPFQWRQDRF